MQLARCLLRLDRAPSPRAIWCDAEEAKPSVLAFSEHDVPSCGDLRLPKRLTGGPVSTLRACLTGKASK